MEAPIEVKSAEYYDDFATRQLQIGTNSRHLAIARWLRHFGLDRGMDVLEIGCGVGVLTELIAERLGATGTLVAVDSSPKSVEFARQRLASHRNVEIQTADAVDLDLERVFDVIVMPDVIEHIPVEQHPRLFANVRQWLKETGWVLIHMPNPLFLDWCHRNRPDLLQLIDQPIFTETLLASIKPNGLYLHYLSTYSIWVTEGDYQVIVLKPRHRSPEFHFAEPNRSALSRIARTLRRAAVLAKRASRLA